MRLTKNEKQVLFELMDVMTDRCPQVSIDRFVNDKDNHIFYGIFRKLRLEIKGF